MLRANSVRSRLLYTGMTALLLGVAGKSGIDSKGDQMTSVETGINAV